MQPSSIAQPNEKPAQQVLAIKRHPIGLILIYIQAVIALAAIIGLGIFAAPNYLTNLSGGAQSLIASGVALLIVLIGGVLGVATLVYRRNCILVTDHDVEQLSQRSLLVRKITRLEMTDVEDVSAEQHGLLQTIFGYGTLTVETAGAVDNFVFTYCPHPNTYAAQILQARARYIERSGTKP